MSPVPAAAAPSAHASADAAPLFGKAEALLMIGDDMALLNDVVDLARGEIAKQLAALESALAAADAPTARRHAHTLKGTVATLGAGQVRDAAFAVEAAARDGDLAAAGASKEQLSNLARRLIAELDAHISQVRSASAA